MEEEKEQAISFKTANQVIYIEKVLKSKKILDSEYKELKKIYDSQVVTSKDASVFLKYLFALTDFRRMFLSERHKAYKKCHFCESREVLRYDNLAHKNQKIWLCENCALNYRGSLIVPIKSEESLNENLDKLYPNGSWKDDSNEEQPLKEVDSDMLYESERDDKDIESMEAQQLVKC